MVQKGQCHFILQLTVLFPKSQVGNLFLIASWIICTFEETAESTVWIFFLIGNNHPSKIELMKLALS